MLAPAAEYLMYVGTYTGPDSKGIYLYRFQPATGEVTSLGLAGEDVRTRPSWRCIRAATSSTRPDEDGIRAW